MDINYEVLGHCALFANISKEDTIKLLPCLKARTLFFKKGDTIIQQGSYPTEAGIIFSGAIQGIKLDYNGNIQLVSSLGVGEIFGDALVSASHHPSPVTVIAHADATVLMVNCESIMAGCSCACKYHDQLRRNLLSVIAGKFWALNQKMAYLSIGCLRTRIAAYLLDMSAGKTSFTLPLNRAEMAGYLGADRSALSRELSRMREDGLIEYFKSSFKIIDIIKIREAAQI